MMDNWTEILTRTSQQPAHTAISNPLVTGLAFFLSSNPVTKSGRYCCIYHRNRKLTLKNPLVIPKEMINHYHLHITHSISKSSSTVSLLLASSPSLCYTHVVIHALMLIIIMPSHTIPSHNTSWHHLSTRRCRRRRKNRKNRIEIINTDKHRPTNQSFVGYVLILLVGNGGQTSILQISTRWIWIWVSQTFSSQGRMEGSQWASPFSSVYRSVNCLNCLHSSKPSILQQCNHRVTTGQLGFFLPPAVKNRPPSVERMRMTDVTSSFVQSSR